MIFSDFKSGRLLLSLLIAITLTGCRSYSTKVDRTAVGFARSGIFGDPYKEKKDLDEALEKTKENRYSRQVIPRDIQESIHDMSHDMRMNAITTIGKIEGFESQMTLIELAHDDKLTHKERELARKMVQERDDSDSLASRTNYFVTYKPEKINAQTIKIFGENQYTDGIPLIASAVEQGRFVKSGVKAIYNMRDNEEAQKVLEEIEKNNDHPGQIEVFKKRLQENDPEKRKEILNRLDHVLQDPSQKDKDVVKLAHRLLSVERPEEYSWMVMTPLARSQVSLSMYEPDPLEMEEAPTKDEPTPPAEELSALESEPELTSDYIDEPRQKKIEGPITSGIPDAITSVIESKPPSPAPETQKQKQKPIKYKEPEWLAKKKEKVHSKRIKKIKVARYPQKHPQYYQYIHNKFFEYFFEDELRETLGKISNALKTYSGEDSPDSAFIIRAYRREFKVNQEKARQMMALGIQQPGCLHAILKNARAEFNDSDLQAYAISELFQITREQAQYMFNLLK